jgi:low temperature requirement protein LtrA
MLGEVVVSLGLFLEQSPVTAENVALSASGFTILALMWWLYFRVSEPLIEGNPVLNSPFHAYSNLLIFLSIIVVSTAIASWGMKDQTVIIWLTASSLTLFVTTLQFILGRHSQYADQLGLNVLRYASCLVPIVLAVIFQNFEDSILVFNCLVVLWLWGINYTQNFTKFIKRIE